MAVRLIPAHATGEVCSFTGSRSHRQDPGTLTWPS